MPNATLLHDAARLGAGSGVLNGQYELTPDLNDKRGGLWSSAKANLNLPFDYSAWVYLGARTGSDGADGMAFAMHNDPRGLSAMGDAGGSISVGGGARITPSLIVEFDTYRNTTFNDPAEDHMAILINGEMTHVTGGATPTLRTFPGTGGLRQNQYHLFRVTWTPTGVGGILGVHLNNTLLFEHSVANYRTFFGFATTAAPEVYWGYTASTGGSRNSHRVCHVTAPVPATADYGDAPESYGQAWHTRPADKAGVHMSYDGIQPSVEIGPRSSANALLDDREDAFSYDTIPPVWSGGHIALRGLGGGYLNAWVDWNRNGAFEANEQIVKDVQDNGALDLIKTIGDNNMQVYVAPRPDLMTGGSGESFLRMRWSTQPGLGATGAAPDGEVEDHRIQLTAPVARTCSGTLPTSSHFATSGSGAYKDQIFWLEWACGGATQFNPGDTVTKTWTLPSGHLLIGRIDQIEGAIRPYRVGSYSGDRLQQIYGGHHSAQNLVGLASRYDYAVGNGNAPLAPFRLTLELRSPTNASLPYHLTTVATDAESLGGTQESLSLATNGVAWAPIDVSGSPYATFSADGRSLLVEEVSGLVVASQRGSEIRTIIDPGGAGAAAFGVFLSADYGDAPASYGGAGHLQETVFQGGSRPTSRSLMTSSHLASRAPAPLRLGALLDTEAGAQHSAEALGDDQAGVDDEDGISAFPVLHVGANAYSIPAANLSAVGTGTLHAWIDFDKNGVFTANEYASVAVTNGVLAGPLNWTGIVVGSAGRSFARLRFTANTLTDDPATPALDERATAFALGGEAEDHAVTFAPPPPLPPDAGMAVCTAPGAANRLNAVSVGWHHNDPPGTLNATIQTDNAPIDGIASGAPLVFGPGLSVSRPNTSFSAYYVAHANLPGAVLAHAAQDYVSYSFTTSATLGPGRYLRNFMLYPVSAQATYLPFRTTILLSTDPNFSTATVVMDGWQLVSNSAQVVRAATAPVLLAPSTTYHMRAIIHDVTSATGSAFWDDFRLFIASCADLSDAPASYGEASHLGGVAMRLGATRTQDSFPLASPDAMGDGATDDGAFLGPVSGGVSLQGAGFVEGRPQLLEFAVTGGGRLSGWIDWNRDGLFAYGLEAPFFDVADNGPGDENPAPGVIGVTITPPALVEGPSFARFRWSSASRLAPAGLAPDGEVEDYAITLAARSVTTFLLSPDHESAVEAGQLAIYPHRLQVGAGLSGGALSFVLESEQGLSWLLLRDDGDGVYGAGDLPWTQGSAIPAGEALFWLVAQTPQETPDGWRDLTRLTALLVKDGASWTSVVQDVTRIGGAGSGSLFARKLQALDVNCDGTPDAGEPGFTPQTLPIAPGGCVIYRILFENRGVEPVRQVRVQDHTPGWMVYVADSARVLEKPAGLTLLPLETPAAGAEGPLSFFFSGGLQPGEGGVVQFSARLP